ncbi:MAG: NifB/NifX family molybdenum-iron cluster-binding protein [candidate division Zixibacteria bacterium]|nr:NifB/NifX family molybdenum-iron cluster-binding protein [candidate division Zixibacteria bacterium]
MKIAIPTIDGVLCPHFGHCQQFAIFDVDDTSLDITGREFQTPPPHEPGVLPNWLGQLGCTVIIAGGMGGRAVQMFQQAGVKVVIGAPTAQAEEVARAFLANTLQTGANMCDDLHGHGQGGGQCQDRH